MKNRYIILMFIGLLPVFMSGCSLFGLDAQEDYDYKTSKYNNQLNMSVWDFMQSRKDLFSGLLAAVAYLENDSATGLAADPVYQGFRDIYTQSGVTYMLLTNTALTSLENSNSYWYKTKVRNPSYNLADTVNNPKWVSGATWKLYPKEKIAEMLRYHVLKGTYDYPHLNSVPVWVDTYAAGDTAKMQIYLSNDRDGIYYINTYAGSPSGTSTKPRTPCLIATNGVVNVMDTYFIPPTKKVLEVVD